MRIGTAAFAAALLMLSAAAAADQPPLYKQHGDWSGRCMSTGLCVIASGPVEIVRGWAWDAKPLVCYYGAGDGEGELAVDIDGQAYPVVADPSLVGAQQIAAGHHAFDAYVRQQGRSGRAACRPAAADTKLLKALGTSRQAIIRRSGRAEPLSLAGFVALAEWMDARQERTATSGALLKAGSADAQDAPHAAPLLRSDPLPRAVEAVYAAPAAACATIRPDNFDGAGAARIALGGGTELFLLPCGEPGANQPMLAVTLLPDGRAINQRLELVSDGKRLAAIGGMNLVWDGRDRRLVGRQSMGYTCAVETQWRPAGDRFELVSQTREIGCTRPDAADAQAWAAVWPAAAEGGAPAATPGALDRLGGSTIPGK
ncbi:DUF1176 domain-containing protein [Chelatococcus reniformis]|uniref:DUF1176 domain-containing protein n=1 Tax=Chelatococcus reniformis TaxID=1494448 RepID=A0A916U8H5_9HYPH|nr:DUF1176 domain-containing protein [Chelatococcus reniformis]GGC64437.1 hypothetical protein GCM10010994_23790 [Chelatococcus reniformis]